MVCMDFKQPIHPSMNLILHHLCQHPKSNGHVKTSFIVKITHSNASSTKQRCKMKKWRLFSCRSQWCFYSSQLSHEWFSQPTYNDIFIFRIHCRLGDDFQSRIAIENTVRRQTTSQLEKIFMSILSEIFQYVLKYHVVLFSKHTDEYLGHLHDFILLCLICQKGVRDKMCLHPPPPTPVTPRSVTWVPLVFSALTIFNK